MSFWRLYKVSYAWQNLGPTNCSLIVLYQIDRQTDRQTFKSTYTNVHSHTNGLQYNAHDSGYSNKQDKKERDKKEREKKEKRRKTIEGNRTKLITI